MVDPLGAVALNAAVNDQPIRDVKIKSMVWLQGVMRVTPQCLLPSDDLTLVLNNHLAFRDINQSKNAFAMNA